LTPVLKVAVVGAGPSGFYAAGALLKAHPASEVSLIEQLPTPYGLVRYGVAPDHPSLKAVAAIFERTGRDARVTFFGNTQLGRDVSLAELLATHHLVIFAIGAPRDRMLGDVGMGIDNVYGASQIVGWYNSDPAQPHFTPHFGRGRVCVFGHGNVAADITRILLSPPERLAGTDISERAWAQLQQMPVREVDLIGRRGPGETRFTPPIIAELLALPGVEVIIDAADEQLADEGAVGSTRYSSSAAREVQRMLRDAARKPRKPCDRVLRIRFGLRPTMIRQDARVLHISLAHGARSNERTHSLVLDAAISATGFELTDGYCGSLPLTAGALSNRSGQLIDEHDQLVPRLYAVGWAARGATGTIGTCRSDAERLVERIMPDLHAMTRRVVGGRGTLRSTLEDRSHHPVGFEQWMQLDRWERVNGAARGRSRLKAPTVTQMLEAMNASVSSNRIDPCVNNA
jgi:ferredoxin--NADP+ reductase